jgi:hypothetical protein
LKKTPKFFSAPVVFASVIAAAPVLGATPTRIVEPVYAVPRWIVTIWSCVGSKCTVACTPEVGTSDVCCSVIVKSESGATVWVVGATRRFGAITAVALLPDPITPNVIEAAMVTMPTATPMRGSASVRRSSKARSCPNVVSFPGARRRWRMSSRTDCMGAALTRC